MLKMDIVLEILIKNAKMAEKKKISRLAPEDLGMVWKL